MTVARVWGAAAVGASALLAASQTACRLLTLTARWLRSPRALRVVDRVTGVVLVGFGVRPALEPH